MKLHAGRVCLMPQKLIFVTIRTMYMTVRVKVSLWLVSSVQLLMNYLQMLLQEGNLIKFSTCNDP
jgi:hypothetical protein